MWVKHEASAHEEALFLRAQKYTTKLSWIPGIKMVAVVNSLSMYATHQDSDIDLFIITQKNRIWIVRFLVTLTFLFFWVWRRWQDIAGNFCLSFFVTEDALELQEIAISDDIYLYFWIYYMKPLLSYDGMYEKFLEKNPWVEVDNLQRNENIKYLLQKEEQSYGKKDILLWFFDTLETVLRYFGMKKAYASYRKKGEPSGVILSHDILKFHDQDRREEIRDACIKNPRE
jgi:hypothetical protein